MKRYGTTQEELETLFDALLFSQRPEVGPPSLLSQKESGRESEVGDMEQLELEGLYIISVAARLLDMHPQTLRKYERLGLVNPCRTIGMLRLYTQRDIARIRLIRHLQEGLGLNLAGVEVALEVLNHLISLRTRLDTTDDVEQLRATIKKGLRALFGSLGFSLNEDEA